MIIPRRVCQIRPGHVILSGIPPTGIPHLGNYLGALSNWVKLQKSAETEDKLLFSIVGWHALTLPQDPASLLAAKNDMLAVLLAIGIDPNRSILFHQDHYLESSPYRTLLDIKLHSAHGETAPDDDLEAVARNSSSEDEVDESVLNAGPFMYPVLQAADVLVYKATHVPVGDDQQQHIELTRDLADIFNLTFKGTSPLFPLPTYVNKSTTHNPQSSSSSSLVAPAQLHVSHAPSWTCMDLANEETSGAEQVELENLDSFEVKHKDVSTEQLPLSPPLTRVPTTDSTSAHILTPPLENEEQDLEEVDIVNHEWHPLAHAESAARVDGLSLHDRDSIGIGPPKVIQNEIKRLQSMPPWIRISIPSRALSVDALLNLPISFTLNDIDKGLAPTFFSKEHALPDSEPPKDFLPRPIPSLALLSELQQLFGQAWFDGCRSIIHTAFPTTPLPFWVLPYWYSMVQVMNARSTWWVVWDWVEKRRESADDDGFMEQHGVADADEEPASTDDADADALDGSDVAIEAVLQHIADGGSQDPPAGYSIDDNGSLITHNEAEVYESEVAGHAQVAEALNMGEGGEETKRSLVSGEDSAGAP
ncbi:tRNA synthetases class I-domain-containing protein [Suillus tomentosus]|nr:tRNA synthetases class I-domain-containing protein [Suillus tomentosus]